MYYAMYGEFSNGDEKYVVNECKKANDGEAECMDDLISYAHDNDCELTFYTCLNNMPDELDDIYNPTGMYWFVDGILMDTSDSFKYEYVEEL